MLQAVYLKLLLICFMSLFPCMKSMGVAGELRQPPGMRCMAMDVETSVIYQVNADNTMWAINITDSHNITSDLVPFANRSDAANWTDNLSAQVRQCVIEGDLLYMVGCDEFHAVVTKQGDTVYLSNGNGSRDYSTLLIVSPLLSTDEGREFDTDFNQFYSSHSTSTNVTRFGFLSAKDVELGIVPQGGGIVNGLMYFYGNNSIIKFTDQYGEASPQRLNITFNIAAVSPDGSRGYFFDTAGTVCQIFIHVVDLETLTLLRSSHLEHPLLTDHTFCNSFTLERNLFIDDNFIYFFISFTQTIYKISRADLQVKDMLENDGKTMFVGSMKGLVGDAYMVGLATGISVLRSFSLQTCPDNEFMTATGCKRCERGYQPNGPFSATGCSPCAVGKFGGLPGFCSDCPANTYNSELGQLECKKCPKGTRSDTPGGRDVSSCYKCPRGTFGVSDGECQTCGEGSYADEEGLLICKPCKIGHFRALGSDSSFCTPCPDRMYSNAESATTCLACPSGTHANGEGASFCPACKPGYVSGEMSASCTMCSPGQFPDFRNSSCESCPAGTFSALGGATKCEACPDGSFSESAGQTKCISCPKGKFSSDRKSCTSCNKDIWGKSGCTPVAYICIGVVGFIVIIAGSVAIVFWWRRRRRRRQQFLEGGELTSDEDFSTSSESEDEEVEEVVEFDVAD